MRHARPVTHGTGKREDLNGEPSMSAPENTPHWRSMRSEDLDGVVRIARIAFPYHFEDRSCFAERLALYPRGCLALDDEQQVAGYLIAYPWTGDSAPALNTLICALPDEADRLYLHDLALDPTKRGRGYARLTVDRLVDQARRDGWASIALVAVNDAAAFWTELGFDIAYDEKPTQKLSSYGADAKYMRRSLNPRN